MLYVYLQVEPLMQPLIGEQRGDAGEPGIGNVPAAGGANLAQPAGSEPIAAWRRPEDASLAQAEVQQPEPASQSAPAAADHPRPSMEDMGARPGA